VRGGPARGCVALRRIAGLALLFSLPTLARAEPGPPLGGAPPAVAAPAQGAGAEPAGAPPLASPAPAEPPPASGPARPAKPASPAEQGYSTVSADAAAGSLDQALWALLPGFVVHGLGHYRAGDERSALRLLLMEGAGLLLLSGAVVSERLSGDAAAVAPYSRPVAGLGAAAFFSSWLLDVIGTWSGRAGTPRYDARPSGPIVGSVYYLLWSDPRQDHLNVFAASLVLPLGRMAHALERVTLWGDGAWDPFGGGRPLLGGGGLRLRVLGEPAETDSRLSLQVEWSEEFRDSQGFGLSSLAGSVEAVWGLETLLSRFRGVLLIARWGGGVEALRYHAVDSGAWSLEGQRGSFYLGEFRVSLPMLGTGRAELGWRVLNDRLFDAGRPGRAPYFTDLSFQIATQMDLHVGLNVGTGFDGWIGVGYRYY